MFELTKTHRRWLTSGGLLLALAGCGRGFAPAGVEVVVRRPPPNRVEVRGTAPNARYVWVPGHHAWRGGDYVWVAGAWTLPPEERYRTWEPGHWVSTRGGWYWVEGRWR